MLLKINKYRYIRNNITTKAINTHFQAKIGLQILSLFHKTDIVFLFRSKTYHYEFSL